MRKLALVVTVGVLGAGTAAGLAGPASAHPHPGHHGNPHMTTTGTTTTPPGHACRAHHRAYVAEGTLVTWTLTQNGNGRYSGSLTILVKHGNRHARGDKGSNVTYTVSNARVRFGKKATNPPAAGSRIMVIGSITTLRKRCQSSTSTFTPVVTIRKIRVFAPASPAPTTTTTTTTTTSTTGS